MLSSDFKVIEEKVSQKSGNDKGLQAEALLTSEEDFRAIFSELPDSQSWIELGSGHGRGPLLFASLYPQKTSIGIEFESARFEISQQLKHTAGLSNVEFIQADLLNCSIPVGDVYFLYFPTGIILDRILHELGSRTGEFKLIAIESHGDLLPRLRKESWLRTIKEIPLHSLRHSPHAVVFEKCGLKTPSFHDLSFGPHYLLVEEENQSSWLAESYGLEWLQGDQFQLAVPPRTICESQVKKILEFQDISPKFHPALQLRKLGNLKFLTTSGSKEGYLRKIYVAPSFKVEISSGEQVEWSDIKKIFWENILCFDSSSDYFYLPHVV